MKKNYDFKKMKLVGRGIFAHKFRDGEPRVRIMRGDQVVMEGTLSEVRAWEAARRKSSWEVLNYEAEQLFAMADRLQETNGSAHELHNRNAYVESALLHARQLTDIFLSRGKEDDDVNLSRLAPQFRSPKIKELAEFYGNRRKNDSACWVINKYLAHATTHRGNSHDYSELLTKLVPLLQQIYREVLQHHSETDQRIPSLAE